MDRIFNRGLARGNAFCNRLKETEMILNNIRKQTPTLIMSPRRYGKTSLAIHAIEKSMLPYAHIDLFLKYDRDSIYRDFYDGIGKLVSSILKPSEKAIRVLEAFMKNMKVSIVLGKLGLEFSFNPTLSSREQSLKELLSGLDDLMLKHEKKGIVFIDEIQAIADSDICEEIESSLRFAAQQNKNISYIYSGSSRHLLSRIFEDRGRPFYKLCQRIDIKRIEQPHYRDFINKFAMDKWSDSLSDEVFSEIFSSSKCHSYYINVLCERIFESETLPDACKVSSSWLEICAEEQGAVANELDFLTSAQKQVLAEVAKSVNLKSPTGKEFLKRVNLTPRGVSQALTFLMNHDFVEKLDSGEFIVIDPVIESIIKDT